MTRRKKQQVLDQNGNGKALKNISLTLEKILHKKEPTTLLRMGDETLLENETQILDATEN